MATSNSAEQPAWQRNSIFEFFASLKLAVVLLAVLIVAAIAGTKSLVYQAALTPTKQQLDAEEEKIIEAMQTDEFRAAVKKFTSKGK